MTYQEELGWGEEGVQFSGFVIVSAMTREETHLN